MKNTDLNYSVIRFKLELHSYHPQKNNKYGNMYISLNRKILLLIVLILLDILFLILNLPGVARCLPDTEDNYYPSSPR